MKLKRILSVLLCVCMLASLMPAYAFAEEGDPTAAETPACEHDYIAAEVVEPTCTEQGYTVYTCPICGDSCKGDYTSATGHTPEEVAEVPAEVGKPGTTAGHICSVCGAVLDGCEPIGALEDEPEEKVIKSAANRSEDEYNITLHAGSGYFYEDTTEITLTVTAGDSFNPYRYVIYNDDATLAIEGWYTEETYINKAAEYGGSFVPAGDIDIYARWVTGYAVTLVANGGYFDGDETCTTKTYRAAPGCQLLFWTDPSTNVEHSTCDGYSLNPDGSGERIYLWTYVPSGDVILYAVWETGYTVTFNANGGYFEENGQSTISDTFVAGAYIRPSEMWTAVNSENPDLTVEGWYLNPECTESACDDYGLCCVESDLVIYAKWAEGYVVTLDANGGYFLDDSSASKTFSVAEGSAVSRNYELRIDDASLIFSHWSLSSDGSGPKINLWTYVPSGDVTLYAIWKTGYTVTMDANGGYFEDWGGDTIVTVELVEGSYFNPFDWGTPVHSEDISLAVEGWYLDSECTQPAFEDGEGCYLTSDLTVYAKWAEGYVVTLDANGGYFYDNSTSKTITVAKGNAVSAGYPLYNDTTGVISRYWSLSTDGSGDLINLWEYVPSSNVTLYAVWEEGYTLTVNANGGYFEENGDSLAIFSVAAGEYFVPGNRLTPVHPDERMGVEGWYLDPECTQPAFEDGEEGCYLTSDLTIYAKWVEEEETVAQNITTGTKYTTLSTALSEAKSGETVELLEDCSDDFVMITTGRTLDLNGKTLTADYVAGFNGSNLIDSSGHNGLLASSNVILNKDNSQMPVKTDEGYKFLTITQSQSIVDQGDPDILYLRTRPYFMSPAIGHQFFGDGMSDNGISIEARLTYTNSQGSSSNTFFTYNDTHASSVYNGGTPSVRFYVRFTGVSTLQNVKATTVIRSDTGVEFICPDISFPLT